MKEEEVVVLERHIFVNTPHVHINDLPKDITQDTPHIGRVVSVRCEKAMRL